MKVYKLGAPHESMQHKGTEEPITWVNGKLMSLLDTAPGEYTEATELGALGITRVEISFG